MVLSFANMVASVCVLCVLCVWYVCMHMYVCNICGVLIHVCARFSYLIVLWSAQS